MGKKFRRINALLLAGMMLFASLSVMAATTNDALEGKNTSGNPTDVVNDLNDFDIIDKDAKGSITIHKYDFTSADEDGLEFNYSTTDHDSDGTDSTMTTGNGQSVNITSTGKKNTAVEEALKEYALKGVEFTYLRVGSVKTMSDVDENNVNGDIELIYGVDKDLMDILGLKVYDAANKGTDFVAVTQVEGTNYFTSRQINEALKTALEVGTYNGSYSTSEAVGQGTNNTTGNRLDGVKGLTAKDAMEDYITTAGANHPAGTAFAETDANGFTTKSDLPLGIYLIVETKVPENVTSTVNPWFVQLPMTDIEGENWFYDVECYPKNQTGHPTLDKRVRNAYGTPGLNYDSAGSASYTSGNRVDHGGVYSENAEVVTNGDTLNGSDYAAWLSDVDKLGDYEYGTTVTASEGDLLDYILVTKLPNITSKATYLTTYEFKDTLSDGLSYNGDAKIAIYNSKIAAEKNDTTEAIDVWTLAKGSNYMFSCNASVGKTNGSTTLDVALTKEGLNEVNKKYYDGYHYLVVYYSAKLESDATTILGDEGNPNDVTLIWKRTSDGYYNTLEDRSIVYSYALDLTKTFSDNNTKPEDFKAVKFEIYNETEDYYVQAKAAATDGLYYVTGKCTQKDQATQFTPGNSGEMVINGIEADEYKLTEVHTAKGYIRLQNQIDIVIHPSSREIIPSSVHLMTAATDMDVEHPDQDQGLVISDGTILTAKEEGTTDKRNMVISALTPANATEDGGRADMCTFGGESVGKAEIDATKNAAVALASANAAVVMSLTNDKGFVLPKTGGSGMYLITIVGVVIAIGGFYSITRKKREGTGKKNAG